MTGYCYIDGIDIYDEFGVIVEGDGYDELLSFPSLKEPDKNDWPEENGIEVDLSEPRLQHKEIAVRFALVRGFSWRPFYAFLSSNGYRTLNIPALGRTWALRVSEMPELEVFDSAALFSVKFVEDNPTIPSGYPDANADIGLPCAVTLDGKRIDKYGIIITGGLDELERSPKLKNALARTNLPINGQTYDADFVRFAQKKVTFGCCLSGAQTEDFWNLYNAFFGDLLKPGLRTVGYKGKNYTAYYSKTDNWKLLSHIGEVVCEFDLTLCFNAFAINSEIYLLASEDGRLIATESGAFIDLNY
jgi:hypothetical protein